MSILVSSIDRWIDGGGEISIKGLSRRHLFLFVTFFVDMFSLSLLHFRAGRIHAPVPRCMAS